jgi:murein DD-endopeptidase MepM/ murein hydrolase activator NlpD
MRPVDAAITSYFGSRRSYGYGFGSYHAGSDFDGLGGEPVLAPADGVVILSEPLVVRGNAILVDHGWGVVSGFWHLSEIAVKVGDRVARGQRIGDLGNTGLSTGAHLHWELWVNGSAVNALSWLEPDGPAAMLGEKP